MSEIAMLSYMLHEPDEYDSISHLIEKANFSFNSKPLELIRQYACHAWKASGRFPTQPQFEEMLARIPHLSPESKAAIIPLVGSVFEASYDQIDKQLVLGRIMEPAKNEIAEMLEKLDAWSAKSQLDEIRKRLDEIEILTNRDVGELIQPFEDNLTLTPKDALSIYLGATLPLFGPQVNSLMEGGCRRGELVMPAAMPGDGKSMSCISMTGTGIRAFNPKTGKRDLTTYYGILDNTGEEVLAKIWANAIQTPTARLATDPEVPRMLERYISQYGPKGRLFLRKFPRKSKSIQEIRRDILTLQRRYGVTFDLIVLDYLDTIRSATNYKDFRHGLDDVTVGAAALAEELQAVVIAPTQLHRAAKFVEVPDIDNLAEAFSKSWHAAVVFMILATKMERISGKCRWFFPKTRRHAEKFMVEMQRTCLYQTFSETGKAPYWIDDNNEEVRSHAEESEKRDKRRKKQLEEPPPSPDLPPMLLQAAKQGAPFDLGVM